MRRLNQALWRMAAAMYPVVIVTPSVASITSTAQTEGTAITHTVALSAAVGGVPAVYAFAITPITASAGSDYTATPTFGSSGVTFIGGNLTVPVGVLSFPIVVATSQDTAYEGTESYSITVAGVTNTVSINDDDTAPTILSVSSASASEGNSVAHTVVVTGTAQMARTFALSFTDITAVGGVDYSTTPTFSSGVTFSGGKHYSAPRRHYISDLRSRIVGCTHRRKCRNLPNYHWRCNWNRNNHQCGWWACDVWGGC
jgi:hypothetical protein